MPILPPEVPSRARDAIDAYLATRSAFSGAMEDADMLFVAGGNDVPDGWWLRYPHVFVDVHRPDAKFNMEPYAWQHIYRTPDEVMSFEVDDDTDGEEASVTPVRGPRLRQTVSAIVAAVDNHAAEEDAYRLKLLHLRSIAFRAIILEREPPTPTLAFPLPPLPVPLKGRDVWQLDELINVLRTIVPPPDKPSGKRGAPNNQNNPRIDNPQQKEDDMKFETNVEIAFTPLPYIEYDMEGALNTVHIGPLPNEHGIIEAEAIFINAQLPDLGKPGKISPDGPGGPGGGQYIEILIDDEPESGRITTVVPHAMHFGSAGHGTHMLHFITSSGDGECIKDDQFVASRVVHIMEITDDDLDYNDPIIIYNLPRAAHRESDIIIDFALVNVPLEERDADGMQVIRDHYVQVYINNLPIGRLDHYNAHRITGLPAADTPYSISLALFEREGDELPYPYARTNPREFKVY